METLNKNFPVLISELPKLITSERIEVAKFDHLRHARPAHDQPGLTKPAKTQSVYPPFFELTETREQKQRPIDIDRVI